MTDDFSIAQVTNYSWRRQGFAWDDPQRPQPVFGIYGFAPTCYLSHLVRDPGFKFSKLDEALYQEHTAVRVRAMRYAVFVVPAELLPTVFQATKEQALLVEKRLHKLAKLSDAEFIDVSAAVEKILGPTTMETREIKAALPGPLGSVRDNLRYVIAYMCAQGRLVRSNVKGGWRSNQHEYARLPEWLPDVDLDAISPEQGRVNLARLYVDSYGPVTLDDFKWWSGLRSEAALLALTGLGDELVRVTAAGQEHYFLARHLDALQSTLDHSPDGLHLLPLWDAYLMAYRFRERFLPPIYYDTIYDKAGNGTNTILVDGVAAGVWDLIEDGSQLTLKAAFFALQVDSRWDALADWLDLLMSATGAKKGRLVRCPLPLDLKYGSRDLFMSPLKEIDGDVVHSVK